MGKNRNKLARGLAYFCPRFLCPTAANLLAFRPIVLLWGSREWKNGRQNCFLGTTYEIPTSKKTYTYTYTYCTHVCMYMYVCICVYCSMSSPLGIYFPIILPYLTKPLVENAGWLFRGQHCWVVLGSLLSVHFDRKAVNPVRLSPSHRVSLALSSPCKEK